MPWLQILYLFTCSDCVIVCSVMCIQCTAKQGSETSTFSPLVNTAAISETSNDSKSMRQTG